MSCVKRRKETQKICTVKCIENDPITALTVLRDGTVAIGHRSGVVERLYVDTKKENRLGFYEGHKSAIHMLALRYGTLDQPPL